MAALPRAINEDERLATAINGPCDGLTAAIDPSLCVFFKYGGASGSSGCGDEEEGADHQNDEDEDGDGDT
uniref:Uncharacterized protein n=1 Tax=Tanacetum cinerariifolium TaxID=118510 RepID=A0A699KZW1_TANCI|nr:hypothetical protein [Tanacetum cinerariifolium]